MKIAEHIRRHAKHAAEDLRMYWNASRFLWRVFTHAKIRGEKAGANEPASALNPLGIRSALTNYRLFTVKPVRVAANTDNYAPRTRDSRSDRATARARV